MQFQQDISDHLKKAKWIEQECARRQAEPERPPRPRPKAANEIARQYIAAHDEENRRVYDRYYRSMLVEKGQVQQGVSDALLSANFVLEEAETFVDRMTPMGQSTLPQELERLTLPELITLLENLLDDSRRAAGAAQVDPSNPSERQQEVLAKIESAKEKYGFSEREIAETAGRDRSNILRMRQGKSISNPEILEELNTAVDRLISKYNDLK